MLPRALSPAVRPKPPSGAATAPIPPKPPPGHFRPLKRCSKGCWREATRGRASACPEALRRWPPRLRRQELEAGDARDDKADAGEPQRVGGLPVDDHAEDRGTNRADPRPDPAGGGHRQPDP